MKTTMYKEDGKWNVGISKDVYFDDAFKINNEWVNYSEFDSEEEADNFIVFHKWMKGDDVMLHDGKYSSQCCQWRNRQSFDDLFKYFVREYCQG